jgi:hypothetical protein
VKPLKRFLGTKLHIVLEKVHKSASLPHILREFLESWEYRSFVWIGSPMLALELNFLQIYQHDPQTFQFLSLDRSNVGYAWL